MRTSTAASYRNVNSLQRGLNVLAAVNRMPGGIATANDIARMTQLHRTTVRRLLETLAAQGYLRRSASDDSYRLQIKVRELSEGFTDDEWVSSVAAPELGELMREVVWPSDLTTLDGDAMMIRETTHRFSPLSFHRAMVGRRIPLLYTASGRAYLAYCPEAEREQLLKLLVAGEDEQASLARDSVLLARMLARVRADGYGVNEGDWRVEPHVGAVALPIRHGDRVLGCVNVIYLCRAVSTATAVERLLPALRRAAERIERGAAEGGRGEPMFSQAGRATAAP